MNVSWSQVISGRRMERKLLAQTLQIFLQQYLPEADISPDYSITSSAKASRLSTNVKVAARLRELQEVTAAKAEVTRESILAELEEARLMAKDNGQPAAAVSASMGKAKLVGLVVDRKEVGAPGEFADIENMTADELRAQFAELVRGLEVEAGFGAPPRGKPH
jgi:hypothetical protein